jgi:4-amino-4-deoxy-L-arabinose transferase-like glycosyltransferase
MTWPLAQHLNTHFASTDTDMFNVYWGNWWMGQALATGQNPYMTKYLVYPTGFNLATFAFSPFIALLWLPLNWIVSPIVAYNLVMWLTIVLACVAMGQLVRYLTGNGWAALLAGITFGFAPCLVAERASHLNMSMMVWIPWAALLITRLMCEAKIRDAVLLAVTIALAFLTRLQVGVLVLLFSGIYFVGLTLVQRKQWHELAIWRLILAGLLSLLLISPLLIYTWHALQQPGAESLLRWNAQDYQTDLLAFVLPPPQHPLLGSWTEAIYKQQFLVNTRYWAYLGLVPLLLVFYAAKTRWREAWPWLLTSLFFFVLALGPWLRFGGRVYPAIKLPYSLAPALFSTIGLNWPNRFNLALMPAVSVLVGLACAQLLVRWKKPWILLIPALLILGEYLVVPVPLTAAPSHSPFYDQMAADADDYALVDLPLTREASEVHRYYQTLHHKPIVGGWDHRVPASALAFIDENPLLGTWHGNDQAQVTLDEALTELSEANVRYFVIHKDQLESAPERMRSLIFASKPVYEDETIYVLSTETTLSQGYQVVHYFDEDLGLLHPAPFLSLTADGDTPWLSVEICWFRGSQPPSADRYRVTLTSTDGTLAYEQTAVLPLAPQGLVCKHVPLTLALPFQPGWYNLSITPLTAEQTLATYTVPLPIHALQTRQGTTFPAMGFAWGVTFDASIELLGYNLEGGDGFVWIDLFWRSLDRHHQAYSSLVQLLDPTTKQPIALNDSFIQKLDWRKGEIFQDRRILWLRDVPQGQYSLGIVLSPKAEPEKRIPAFDKHSTEPWPDNMAIPDIPALVLPATLKDSPVSKRGRVVAYTTATEPSLEPQHKISESFGEVGQLLGYSLEPQEATAGKELKITLYWMASNKQPLAKSYTVFVHLLDKTGQIVAQHDGQPVVGRRSTLTWQEGDRIVDTHKLEWRNLEYTGQATIVIGLYDAATLDRLPVYGPDGERVQDDRAILGEIQVK